MTAPITNSVTICNSALLKIGADRISDLSQNTRAAIVCNTLYEYLRDEVLGAHPWRFAIKRAVLAPNSTVPAFDYDYQYDLPSDCIRPLRTDDDAILWIVEGSQILTDEPTLNMTYIYRNVDESSWTALFCEALAWRLAMELAYALAQSLPLKQDAEKSYEKHLAQARAMNGLTGTLLPLEADIWTNARRGNRWNPITGFNT